MSAHRNCAAAAAALLLTTAVSAQEGAPPVNLTPTDLTPARLATSPGADAYHLTILEDAIDRAYATGDFVGLSIAIVRGGQTRFVKSWGVVEVGGAPVTPATVFRLASLSKGFASGLAGLAMTEGLLSPEDKATGFAPTFKLAGGAEARLELGHLLSHQTGLPPNAYDNLLEADTPVADIYPKYKGVKLICPVGQCYSYQNIAYDIVGAAISSAYGEPYGDALKRRLFAPLGMTTASVDEAGLAARGDWARPYVRKRLSKTEEIYEPWRKVEVKPAYYRVPAAGGVNASILDMAEWLKAQMGDRPDVLPRAALDLIHAPRVVSPAETARMRRVSPRFRAAQYAFGWRLYTYGEAPLNAPVIAHAGTVDGYAAQIAFLPEQDVGIVILSNARSKRLWRILPTFLDLELGLSREDWLELDEAGAAIAGSQ